MIDHAADRPGILREDVEPSSLRQVEVEWRASESRRNVLASRKVFAVYEDVGAALRERFCDSKSDPARRAGNQRHVTCEIESYGQAVISGSASAFRTREGRSPSCRNPRRSASGVRSGG